MKIINIEQGSEEWKSFRKGKITGTKSSDCLSMPRKSADGSTVKKGWWQLLAEKMTYNENDGTSGNPMDRGHELEKDCAEITVAKFRLTDPLYDCGVWLSDDSEIMVSPDCHENSEHPTWAIECKALNSSEHIRTIYRDIESRLCEIPEERFSVSKKWNGRKSLDYIPQEYREQAVSYFIVNDSLQTLYFSLYDPRFINPKLAHWVFVINREDIEYDIENLKELQSKTVDEIEKIKNIIENALKGECNEY